MQLDRLSLAMLATVEHHVAVLKQFGHIQGVKGKSTMQSGRDANLRRVFYDIAEVDQRLYTL